jgi:hypothetical protein
MSSQVNWLVEGVGLPHGMVYGRGTLPPLVVRSLIKASLKFQGHNFESQELRRKKNCSELKCPEAVKTILSSTSTFIC